MLECQYGFFSRWEALLDNMAEVIEQTSSNELKGNHQLKIFIQQSWKQSPAGISTNN